MILAEKLQLHPNYVSTFFRKEMGTTFIHYLHSYRIQVAKKWIAKSPELSLDTIGHQVGYPSISYFYRMFKKYTGKTPGQYREMLELSEERLTGGTM